MRVAWAAPAVGAGYAILAYGVVVVGCMPPFADVDFFGVPVTVFLLLALTVAALILIVLGLMHARRVLRAPRGRYVRDDPRRARRIGAAAVLLAIAAFVAVAWLGSVLLQMPCAA